MKFHFADDARDTWPTFNNQGTFDMKEIKLS